MSDIVQQLRDSATQARALDRASLLYAAAAEIARLRLTDAERDAVRFFGEVARLGEREDLAATLRGLLERTK